MRVLGEGRRRDSNSGGWRGKITFARSEPPTKPIATFFRRVERMVSISGVTDCEAISIELFVEGLDSEGNVLCELG